MISPTILLIHPPGTSPVHPCWDAAVVAGSLSDSTLNPCHYDANLDFYREHLFPVCETRGEINKLTGKDFYDPACFLSAKLRINTGLSEAFQSCPLTGFQNHEGKGEDSSPFARLCDQGLERQFAHHDPGTVIFFVSSQDQSAAAQAMAAYIKSRSPGVWVLAMANIRSNLLNSPSFDHLIWNRGPKGLVSLIDFLNQIHGSKIDPHTISPEFHGLPLGQYLTPERVIWVDPFFFKDPVFLAAFLEDQVRCLGIRGFVFARAAFHPDALGGTQEEGGDFPSAGMYRHLAHWLSIKQAPVFFCMQVRIGDPFPEDEHELSDLFLAGLRLILWEVDTWEVDAKNTKIWESKLWKASKQGIWNHVSCPDLFREKTPLAKFIVNTPNIVHSFQNTNQNAGHMSIGDLSPPAMPPGFMDYERVQPLPGISFWNVLGDAGTLLVYLGQFTRKSLGCLRADMINNSIVCLGRQIVFSYQSPADLPPGILDEICKMVEAGGSVDITHVRFNLERAYKIGYAMENGVIIGNSSLKHPREVFIKRLKKMTGVDFSNFVERGYTSVRPEYRAMGVGAKLLEGLTKLAKNYKVFSIISEENLATQKIALRNNTKKILTYFSEKLNKEMGVWMPGEMIDNSVDIDTPVDKERGSEK